MFLLQKQTGEMCEDFDWENSWPTWGTIASSENKDELRQQMNELDKDDFENCVMDSAYRVISEQDAAKE